MINRTHSATKRRIAILSPSLAGRGAERKALYIASGLLERGHEVDFLLQRPIVHYPGEVPSRARIYFSSERSDARTRENLGRISGVPRPLVAEPLPWRIRYPRIGMSMRLRPSQLPLLMSTRLPRWAAGVAAYLDRERPDALLAMNVLAVAAATMATHVAQRPVRTVATLHESLNRRRLLRRARCSYPYADSVVGVSHGVSTEFAKITGLKCGYPQVIHNPVVSQSIERRSREPANHPWLDSPELPVILAIGKLNKSKNFPLLLAAFAQFLTHRPARLVVLGDGRMRPKLLALAKRLGIEESVDFPGFKENPFAFLAKANLFVLSSGREALPTVLIEAMACGCPVVSTDCPFGPREILEEGRFGPLVPVGDSEALAAAMVRVLNAPPSRNVLRERSALFSIDRAVDRYEALLLPDDE